MRVAGTKLAVEASLQHGAGRSLDLGSAREQHQYKVDPNEVRALPPGMCFVMGSGRAQKVQVAPAPRLGRPPAPSGGTPPVDPRPPDELESPDEPLRL